MNIRSALLHFPISLVLGGLIATAPVSAAQVPPTAEAERSAAAPYSDRLALLKPEVPGDYFRLAEEVADADASFGGTRLALKLYAIAFEIGRRTGRSSLAGSAAMGMAAKVRSDRDRRALQSIARAVDPRQAGAPWIAEQDAANSDSAPFMLATAMGMLRSGDGPGARRLLEQPAVQAVVEAYAVRLSEVRLPGGAAGMVRESLNWPCRDCANSRVIRRGAGSPPEYRLCTGCRGNPGLVLTTDELAAQLRMECQLLMGSQRSWASQLSVDHGAPLIQADPADVFGAIGIDPTRCRWRDGVWIEGELPPDPNAKVRPTGGKPSHSPATSVSPVPPGAPDAAGPSVSG